MALYEVTGPDGTIYEVTGPKGAVREDLIDSVLAKIEQDKIARLNAKIDKSFLQKEVPEEETKDTDNILENIYKGTWTGFVHGLETAALGAITPLGEETEASARDIIRSVAESVKPELANIVS